MIIPIQNEEQWHALRLVHIGASEVGALANVSPWATAFSVYQVKKGNAQQPPVSDDVENGRDFEHAIAKRYAIDNQLDLIKVSEYHSCEEEPFLGATLDYYFQSDEGEPIATEIKHVRFASWVHHQWSPETDYMPPHIEMQLVAQLLATGWAEGRVVAFCDGEYYSFTRRRGEERVEKMAATILQLVRDMKDRLAKAEPPPAFGKPVELTMMGIIAPVDKTKPVIDLSHDQAADALVHHYNQATEAKSTAEKEIEMAKAKITELFMKNSNEPAVSGELKTEHYTLKRNVIDVKARTQEVKAHQQVRFTAKLREDKATIDEPSNPIMAG